MQKTPVLKQWTLPAGSKVQVGDLKYRLVADTVVLGVKEPKWLEGPFLGEASSTDETAAESGEGSLSQDQSTHVCGSP